MRRRDFIKRTAFAGTVIASPTRPVFGLQVTSRARTGRKVKYVGWQVGITYQTPQPGGLDRGYLMRLLDEMAAHKMNLLSLMMISYGFFDPRHDGYCWPVRNPRLRCYWDSGAANAQPTSEFVRDVIAAAADRHIQVQLFMNWGIWNPDKIRLGYPDVRLQINRKQEPAGWLHCPDSPGAWQAGLDEVANLMEFYNHPNVTSYGLERISYGGRHQCYCRDTQHEFQSATGGSLLDANETRFDAWKTDRISNRLKEYVRHIKRIRPNVGVWLHTRCAAGWGHDPARLRGCGVDYLLPHVIQFPETKEQLHRDLARVAPNPCVLHFCTRDQRPTNYKLWIKTPEIIAEAIDWVVGYPGDNLAGLLFFNEVATSPRNKKAVYELIKRFEW